MPLCYGYHISHRVVHWRANVGLLLSFPTIYNYQQHGTNILIHLYNNNIIIITLKHYRYHNHTLVCKTLVEAHARIDILTRGGKTPHQCAVVGHAKEAREFLSYTEDLRR